MGHVDIIDALVDTEHWLHWTRYFGPLSGHDAKIDRVRERYGLCLPISGMPFSNCAFNLRLRTACKAIGMGEIAAHGLWHSAAPILLNHVGKDLREIQELFRHNNIPTTVRYTNVGYEQTRQTAEALSRVLE
jgi:site-specific recombinase XerD